MPHTQHYFSFTVQPSRKSIKQREASISQTQHLQSGSSITSVWPGAALVKAGGWEMVTCLTSLVSLLALCRFWRWWCKDTWMQNQLESIKAELLASALRGGREVEAEPWTIMQNISCSGLPEILLLWQGPAPARGGSLGLAPAEFTLQQPAQDWSTSAWASLDQSWIFVKLLRYLCIMLHDFRAPGIPAPCFPSWWGVVYKSMPV